MAVYIVKVIVLQALQGVFKLINGVEIIIVKHKGRLEGVILGRIAQDDRDVFDIGLSFAAPAYIPF